MGIGLGGRCSILTNCTLKIASVLERFCKDFMINRNSFVYANCCLKRSNRTFHIFLVIKE